MLIRSVRKDKSMSYNHECVGYAYSSQFGTTMRYTEFVQHSNEGLDESKKGFCRDEVCDSCMGEELDLHIHILKVRKVCIKRMHMERTECLISLQASLSMYAWNPFQKSSKIWRPSGAFSSLSSSPFLSCKRRRRAT